MEADVSPLKLFGHSLNSRHIQCDAYTYAGTAFNHGIACHLQREASRLRRLLITTLRRFLNNAKAKCVMMLA